MKLSSVSYQICGKFCFVRENLGVTYLTKTKLVMLVLGVNLSHSRKD